MSRKKIKGHLNKYLTLFRMGLFKAEGPFLCEGGGGVGAESLPFPKICKTYPKMMKLGTVTPYLKKIQKT